LTIQDIVNLQGRALGASLGGLLQNIPQLQRLFCADCALRVEGVCAFQPALQMNRTLKELSLMECSIGNTGVLRLADTLVGNTVMEVLDISSSYLTADGLDDVTRMIESTQLKTIDFAWNNRGIFNDPDAIQRFVSTLHQKKSSVQELPMIHPDAAYITSIKKSLKRNQQLNRVALLLAPPPPSL
jgi:Leucine Rich repeat